MESEIEKFGSLRTKTHKGVPTKRALRFDRLVIERNYCDNKRWCECGMTKSMWRAMGTGQYKWYDTTIEVLRFRLFFST